MNSIIRDLKRHYDDRKLSLFVGAGVSKSCNLPDWSELSSKIIKEVWAVNSTWDFGNASIQYYFKDSEPIIAMRRARHKVGAKFNDLVREKLYDNPEIKISETVKAIVSLKKFNSICCFNYDDLLEEGFYSVNAEVAPIIEGDKFDLDMSGFQIFHPHGFLPRLDILTKYRDYSNNRIILSEDDYHDLYSTPNSWANIVQLGLLLNSYVLFIGMSLKDPNIRRLLDICSKFQKRQKYYAILKNPQYHPEAKGWEGAAYAGFQRIEEESLNDIGITPIWVDTYDEIPEIIKSIA